MGKKLTAGKAKLMLEEGTVRGHPLTAKQKGLFGLIAGGGTPSKLRRKNPSPPYGHAGTFSARGKIGIG